MVLLTAENFKIQFFLNLYFFIIQFHHSYCAFTHYSKKLYSRNNSDFPIFSIKIFIPHLYPHLIVSLEPNSFTNNFFAFYTSFVRLFTLFYGKFWDEIDEIGLTRLTEPKLKNRNQKRDLNLGDSELRSNKM